MAEKRTRTRKGTEFWKTHVAAWSESGMTIREYCREKGLMPVTLAYWKKKFEEPEEENVPHPFVEVRVPAVRDFTEQRIFEIVYGSLRLVVREDIGNERLLTLLECIRG